VLITRKLKEPCPKCGSSDNYGNVNVGKNILNRGCNSCGEWTRIPLPDFRKHVIYLDQFFLSHAFRRQEQKFVDAAKRIKDMASRQLIVCPYSSVHTDETHLWRNDQQENLYKFIKQTARGYKFSQAYEIKLTQMTKGFESFIAGGDISQSIDQIDAFRENVHRWDDYFWIDLRPILGDLDAMRQGKADAIAALVGLFPEWSQFNSSFEEDVKSEALGYGESLFNLYLEMAFKVAPTGDFWDYLNAPIDSMYVESLLRFDSANVNIDNRLKRVCLFVTSEYFVSIPYIAVSCGLFAVLRKFVKNGAFTNQEKAKKKLSGLFYDSECISVFGPYCDAVFIDRTMRQWCYDPEARLLDKYNTRAFSAEVWGEFHQYLDQIERDAPDDIDKYLSMVYPTIC